MTLIYSLFAPWLNALYTEAYGLYAQSDLYITRLNTKDSSYAFEMYYKYNMLDYLKFTLKKKILKIIFMPWAIIPHIDILEFGRKLNEKNN